MKDDNYPLKWCSEAGRALFILSVIAGTTVCMAWFLEILSR